MVGRLLRWLKVIKIRSNKEARKVVAGTRRWTWWFIKFKLRTLIKLKLGSGMKLGAGLAASRNER